MFMIVCTICGYLAVTLLFTLAPALPPSRRYPIIAAIAVLVPTLAYLIGGLGYGTYTGSFGTILAFIGVGALYMFVDRPGHPPAPGAHRPGRALRVARDLRVPQHPEPRRHLHRPRCCPRFWRFLNHFWIGAETTNAERSILYFGGPGVGTRPARLLAWTAVIVALLLLPVSRKLAFRAPAPRLAKQA